MSARFPLRYDGVHRAMALAGMGPSRSWVELDDDWVRVRMGWAARADIPLERVDTVERDTHPRLLGWGVHGWRGSWLVNGSSKGIVRIDLEGPVRAWMGGFPVRLRRLWVSLQDPEAFLIAFGRIRLRHGSRSD